MIRIKITIYSLHTQLSEIKPELDILTEDATGILQN